MVLLVDGAARAGDVHRHRGAVVGLVGVYLVVERGSCLIGRGGVGAVRARGCAGDRLAAAGGGLHDPGRAFWTAAGFAVSEAYVSWQSAGLAVGAVAVATLGCRG